MQSSNGPLFQTSSPRCRRQGRWKIQLCDTRTKQPLALLPGAFFSTFLHRFSINLPAQKESNGSGCDAACQVCGVRFRWWRCKHVPGTAQGQVSRCCREAVHDLQEIPGKQGMELCSGDFQHDAGYPGHFQGSPVRALGPQGIEEI